MLSNWLSTVIGCFILVGAAFAQPTYHLDFEVESLNDECGDSPPTSDGFTNDFTGGGIDTIANGGEVATGTQSCHMTIADGNTGFGEWGGILDFTDAGGTDAGDGDGAPP